MLMWALLVRIHNSSFSDSQDETYRGAYRHKHTYTCISAQAAPQNALCEHKFTAHEKGFLGQISASDRLSEIWKRSSALWSRMTFKCFCMPCKYYERYFSDRGKPSEPGVL